MRPKSYEIIGNIGVHDVGASFYIDEIATALDKQKLRQSSPSKRSAILQTTWGIVHQIADTGGCIDIISSTNGDKSILIRTFEASVENCMKNEGCHFSRNGTDCPLLSNFRRNNKLPSRDGQLPLL